MSEKNYAYESGSFMALARMMSDAVKELETTTEYDREWALTRLRLLAEQTDDVLKEFGYSKE